MKTPQSNNATPPNPPPKRGRTKRGNAWTPVRVPGSDQGSSMSRRPAPPILPAPDTAPAAEGDEELSAYRQTSGG